MRALMVLALSFAACAVREGEITGTVRVPICNLDGPYALEPEFFAAEHDGRTLHVRLQRDSGSPEFIDHLTVTVDDTHEVGRLLASSGEQDEQGRSVVTLPVGPPGVPGVIVHATLFPTHSCGRRKSSVLGQNVGLPAREGRITFRSIDLGPASGRERRTDVPAFRMILQDTRPVGAGAPGMVDPSSPVGEAELAGHFRYDHVRSVPAQTFP